MSTPKTAIEVANKSGTTMAVFSEGLGFDGSSIRGWKGIAGDMLAMLDPATVFIDPFMADSVLEEDFSCTSLAGT